MALGLVLENLLKKGGGKIGTSDQMLSFPSGSAQLGSVVLEYASEMQAADMPEIFSIFHS